MAVRNHEVWRQEKHKHHQSEHRQMLPLKTKAVARHKGADGVHKLFHF